MEDVCAFPCRYRIQKDKIPEDGDIKSEDVHQMQVISYNMHVHACLFYELRYMYIHVHV